MMIIILNSNNQNVQEIARDETVSKATAAAAQGVNRRRSNVVKEVDCHDDYYCHDDDDCHDDDYCHDCDHRDNHYDDYDYYGSDDKIYCFPFTPLDLG